MATPGRSNGLCPTTGLAVPECSCRSCLEEMLGRFRPELVPDEIRITRAFNRAPEHAERDPEAGRDQPS